MSALRRAAAALERELGVSRRRWRRCSSAAASATRRRARVPRRRRGAPAERVRRHRRAPSRRSSRHVAAGARITVHGDYDVDGVCSTAVLVRALRALGADVDWYLPDRAEDGYGLARATVERLAARGTRPADHRRLRDHRRRGGRAPRALPGSTSSSPTTTRRAPTASCPTRRSCIRRVCGYPCAELCATAVALQARAGAAERRARPREPTRPRPGGARDGRRRGAAARREPRARARGLRALAAHRASRGCAR